jgi:hypothetical protein
MLRPCCDYIAAMLRPVLRAPSNISSLFSLFLNTTPNMKKKYATFKNNIRNI